MREIFLVFPRPLGVEEGDKDQFFVVLKSGLCLANNIVKNPAVELVVVRARISRWTSLCSRSACGAFSSLVDFYVSAPLSCSTVSQNSFTLARQNCTSSFLSCSIQKSTYECSKMPLNV